MPVTCSLLAGHRRIAVVGNPSCHRGGNTGAGGGFDSAPVSVFGPVSTTLLHASGRVRSSISFASTSQQAGISSFRPQRLLEARATGPGVPPSMIYLGDCSHYCTQETDGMYVSSSRSSRHHTRTTVMPSTCAGRKPMRLRTAVEHLEKTALETGFQLVVHRHRSRHRWGSPK